MSGFVVYATQKVSTGHPSDAERRMAYTYGDYFDDGSLTSQIVLPSSNPLSPSADNQAIAKLYDALQAFEGTQGTGEDLGELGQTLKLLTSPFKGLRTAVLSMDGLFNRALRKRTSAAVAKGLADATLEYKFGVLPFVNSISGVVSGLEGRDYLFNYYPFQCSGRSDSGTYQDVKNVGLGSGFYFNTSMRTTTLDTVRYKGVWSAQAGVDRRAVSDVLGLRWQDIIPTMWNLLPYSWMFDYVTNIGVIAQSLSVPWGGVRWCNRTVRREVTWTLSASPSNFGLGPFYDAYGQYIRSSQSAPGFLVIQGKKVSRQNQTTIPIPQFAFSNANHSVGHIINLAALLASKTIGLSGLLRSARTRFPDLPRDLSLEYRRRGEKIPYPFHN
jgi:hypothetical protein